MASIISISGSDNDFGLLANAVTVKYLILNNGDGTPLIVTEYFDSTVMGTYTRLSGGNYNINFQTYFNSANYGTHTIKIKATTTDGSVTEYRTYTFTKIQTLHAIYDNDPDLGVVYDLPTIRYSIADSECTENKVVESFDGKAVNCNVRNTLETYTTNFRTYYNDASLGVHTITISAFNGIDTVYRNYTFTKKQSIAPTISGVDSDLGLLISEPTINYYITDPDNTSFIITEYFDDKQIYSYTGSAGVTYSINWQSYFDKASYDKHTIKITVHDGSNLVTRIYTFTKMMNDAPTISGSDANLGELMKYKIVEYSLTSPNNKPLVVTESFDDTIMGNYIRDVNTDYQVDWQACFDLTTYGTHTIKISATDGLNTVVRTYTFTKVLSIAPTISGVDSDLGILDSEATISYSVTDHSDPNGKFTVTEYFDNTIMGIYTRSSGIIYVIGFQTYFDLANYGTHTIKISATDGISTVVRTYTFIKKQSIIPGISGNDSDLGSLYSIPTISYYVTDPDSNPVKITEYFDNIAIGTYTRNTGTKYSVDFQSYYTAASYAKHTVKISVNDGSNTVIRTYTFTKAKKPINSLPTISGVDSDLGILYFKPTIDYIITDINNNPLVVTEFFNDAVMGTYIRDMSVDYQVDFQSFYNDADYGVHTVKISVTDGTNIVNRVFTFTKALNAIPVISGTDGNLGTIYSAPVVTYSIADKNNYYLNVNIYIENTNNSSRLTLGSYIRKIGTIYSIDWNDCFNSLPYGNYAIIISVGDGLDTVERKYVFTKTKNPISFIRTGELYLGQKSSSFTVNFTVNNNLSHVTNAIVKLDNVTIGTIAPVNLGVNTSFTVSTATVQALPNLSTNNHILSIICTDSSGYSNTLTYTFGEVCHVPLVNAPTYNLGKISTAPTINFNVIVNVINTGEMDARYYLDGDLINEILMEKIVASSVVVLPDPIVTSGLNSFNLTPFFSNLNSGQHRIGIKVFNFIGGGNTIEIFFEK
jgi:hypothetical protein